jgi:hypothetical protein
VHAKLMTISGALLIGLATLPLSTPRITGIAPSSPVAGPAPQSLTITGEGFMRGLSVTVTTPVGTTQVFKDMDVQSQEEASFRVAVTLATPGTYNFVVTNTDGGVSQPFGFKVGTVAPAASAPVIDAVVPARVTKGTQPQVLRFDGKRFVQGLTVNVSDPAGNATTISGSAITNVTQNAFDASIVLGVEGEYTLTVHNPDGQISNAVSLSVRLHDGGRH